MGDSNPISVKNAREKVEQFKQARGIDDNSEAIRQALDEVNGQHPHVKWLETTVWNLVLIIAMVTLVAAGTGLYADIFTARRALQLAAEGLGAIVMVEVAFEIVRVWYARRPPNGE